MNWNNLKLSILKVGNSGLQIWSLGTLAISEMYWKAAFSIPQKQSSRKSRGAGSSPFPVHFTVVFPGKEPASLNNLL